MRLRLSFAVTLLWLGAVPSASAWGTLGHETVGWIAQNYVSSNTRSFIQGVLSSTSTDYMASFATWADSYRTTTAGKWSAPLHFIDANDTPPSSCSVDFDRDCGASGCVVSAIVNYTSILLDGSSSKAEKYDAMKFIIHFVGDIHQPLHDEASEVGGNDIDVTYDSEKTNLHHIWDTEIVETLAGGQNAQDFGSSIVTAINGGAWSDVATWSAGMTLNNVESSAMVWASEANKYVCSDVLAGGVSSVEKGDLDGSYYQAHGQVARLQIARAGYRLGKWLNLIATGDING